MKPASASTQRSAPMSTFDQFHAAFQGDILGEDSPDYDQAIARWAANAARRAKYICFVKGTGDVELALKFARNNGLKIAIRGGGSDPGGASSEEGGLIIDMSRYFNGFRIDPEAKLVYAGGGALGRDVDRAAAEHGLAAVCGTVNWVSCSSAILGRCTIKLTYHVGRDWRVGRFIVAASSFCELNHIRIPSRSTLGGGFGWLSAEHGLSIDSLVQVTNYYYFFLQRDLLFSVVGFNRHRGRIAFNCEFD